MEEKSGGTDVGGMEMLYRIQRCQKKKNMEMFGRRDRNIWKKKGGRREKKWFEMFREDSGTDR